VLEKKVGPSAINRSMELTRPSYWRYFLLCGVTLALHVVIMIVTQVPREVLPQIDCWLVSAALTWLMDLYTPWMTLVFVAAYVAASQPPLPPGTASQGEAAAPEVE
jgi:hypothetical protein